MALSLALSTSNVCRMRQGRVVDGGLILVLSDDQNQAMFRPFFVLLTSIEFSLQLSTGVGDDDVETNGV